MRIVRGLVTVAAVAFLSCVEVALMSAREILYVTNSGGADVTLVDVETRKVIGTIATGPTPHGIMPSPDGTRIYISRETDNDVIAIDTATGKELWQAPVGGRPNEIAVSADGRYVYVPVRSADYAAVVDTQLQKKILEIPVGKYPHNAYAAPNGKWIYVTSLAEHKISIIDVATQKVIGVIPTGGEPRPAAITSDNKFMFVALTGLHGFVVADITQQKVVDKVELPPADVAETSVFGYTPTHGLAIRPDNSQLWITNVFGNTAEGFSLPDHKLLASVPVGMAANWMTFDVGGRYLYVSNPGSNDVTVIDTDARKVIASIPVGLAPKRLISVNVPAGMDGPDDAGWKAAASRPSTTDYYLKGGGVLGADTTSFDAKFRSGELTPQSVPAFYHQMGIRGIVLNSRYFTSWDDAYMDRVKQSVTREGRVAIALRLDGSLLGDKDATAKQIELAKTLLRAAQIIKAPVVRISLNDDNGTETVAVKATNARAIAVLKQLVPVAKKTGIRIAIEHELTGLDDPILEIVHRTDPAWVGLCVDFENWKTDDPKLEAALRQVVPIVYGTRMRGYDFDNKGDESTIDYREALPHLVNSGYGGPVSINYEGKGNQVTGAAKLRDLMVNLWKTKNEKR